MVLRWQPSESDGGSKITEYVVERREVGKKSWKKVGSSSSKNTYLEIRGLKKNCSFNFRISAKNNIGLSQPLVLDETVKGKAEVKTAARGLPGSPSVQVRFFVMFMGKKFFNLTVLLTIFEGVVLSHENCVLSGPFKQL